MVKLPPIDAVPGNPTHLAASPLHTPSAPVKKVHSARVKRSTSSREASVERDGVRGEGEHVVKKRKQKRKMKRKSSSNARSHEHDPVSRLSVAEAAYWKGSSPVLYRGRVDQDIVLVDRELSEAAARRLAASRQASAAFREQARRARGKRQEKRERDSGESSDLVSPLPAVEQDCPDIATTDVSSHEYSSDRESNKPVFDSNSLVRVPSPAKHDRATPVTADGQNAPTERPGSVLTALKPKHSLATRMLNLGKCAKLLRTKNLKYLWRNAVSALPEDERQRLEQVFQRGGESVGQLEMRLLDLGFKANCEEEREEIIKLCREVEQVSGGDLFYAFAGHLVPSVDMKMRDRYSRALQESFAKADKWRVGRISSDACLNIIVEDYVSHVSGDDLHAIKDDFQTFFKDVSDPESQKVGFEGFCDMMWRIRKEHVSRCASHECKVMDLFGMDRVEVSEGREELLAYYEMLMKNQKRRDATHGVVDEGTFHLDAVDVKGLIGILTEYGVIPGHVKERAQMEQIIQDICSTGPVSLKELQFLLQRLRAVNVENHREYLQDVFRRYDVDKNGALNHIEVSGMFGDLGLLPRCKAEQTELKRMLERVDADESGQIEFEEFEDLYQNVTERMRSMQRRRENETARELNFTPKEVTELRESFFTLDDDASGGLQIPELRQTLTMMRKTLSGPELNELVSIIDKDRDGEINFQEFLYFVKAIQHPTKGWREFLSDELGEKVQDASSVRDGNTSVLAAAIAAR